MLTSAGGTSAPTWSNSPTITLSTLTNTSTSRIDGAVGGLVIASGVSVTITAGKWLVQAQASMISLTVSDSAYGAIYNVTTSAEVGGSRGCAQDCQTAVSLIKIFPSNLTVITVAGNTQLCPMGNRNGGSSQLSIQTGGASAPSCNITAIIIG